MAFPFLHLIFMCFLIPQCHAQNNVGVSWKTSKFGERWSTLAPGFPGVIGTVDGNKIIYTMDEETGKPKESLTEADLPVRDIIIIDKDKLKYGILQDTCLYYYYRTTNQVKEGLGPCLYQPSMKFKTKYNVTGVEHVMSLLPYYDIQLYQYPFIMNKDLALVFSGIQTIHTIILRHYREYWYNPPVEIKVCKLERCGKSYRDFRNDEQFQEIRQGVDFITYVNQYDFWIVFPNLLRTHSLTMFSTLNILLRRVEVYSVYDSSEKRSLVEYIDDEKKMNGSWIEYGGRIIKSVAHINTPGRTELTFVTMENKEEDLVVINHITDQVYHKIFATNSGRIRIKFVVALECGLFIGTSRNEIIWVLYERIFDRNLIIESNFTIVMSLDRNLQSESIFSQLQVKKLITARPGRSAFNELVVLTENTVFCSAFYVFDMSQRTARSFRHYSAEDYEFHCIQEKLYETFHLSEDNVLYASVQQPASPNLYKVIFLETGHSFIYEASDLKYRNGSLSWNLDIESRHADPKLFKGVTVDFINVFADKSVNLPFGAGHNELNVLNLGLPPRTTIRARVVVNYWMSTYFNVIEMADSQSITFTLEPISLPERITYSPRNYSLSWTQKTLLPDHPAMAYSFRCEPECPDSPKYVLAMPTRTETLSILSWNLRTDVSYTVYITTITNSSFRSIESPGTVVNIGRIFEKPYGLRIVNDTILRWTRPTNLPSFYMYKINVQAKNFASTIAVDPNTQELNLLNLVPYNKDMNITVTLEGYVTSATSDALDHYIAALPAPSDLEYDSQRTLLSWRQLSYYSGVSVALYSIQSVGQSHTFTPVLVDATNRSRESYSAEQLGFLAWKTYNITVRAITSDGHTSPNSLPFRLYLEPITLVRNIIIKSFNPLKLQVKYDVVIGNTYTYPRELDIKISELGVTHKRPLPAVTYNKTCTELFTIEELHHGGRFKVQVTFLDYRNQILNDFEQEVVFVSSHIHKPSTTTQAAVKEPKSHHIAVISVIVATATFLTLLVGLVVAYLSGAIGSQKLANLDMLQLLEKFNTDELTEIKLTGRGSIRNPRKKTIQFVEPKMSISDYSLKQQTGSPAEYRAFSKSQEASPALVSTFSLARSIGKPSRPQVASSNVLQQNASNVHGSLPISSSVHQKSYVGF